ncbi:MAG: TolC family protein [Chitinophagaceae bacterium]
MNKHMRKAFFICTLLLSGNVFAQSGPVRSYLDIISIALKNNYDIELARNNTRIAAAQNTAGAAGMLPRLDINANGNKASNDTKQDFSSGLTVNQKGVQSETVAAGAYLTWTVFDGLKMFATKERLKLLEQQSELSLRLQVETTIEEVTLYYYQVVKQQQLINGIEASMSVSDERIHIADKKLTLGSGSNVELLQARLDMNALKSDWITQRYILNEYKNNLMVLIKEQPDTSFTVDTNFEFAPIASMEHIREMVERNNTSIALAGKNVLVYDQTIRELRSQTMPKLALNTNYVFSRNSNAAGFTLLNQNTGLNYGFTFTWNLFNGLNTRNQVKVAKLQTDNARLQFDQTKLSVSAAALSAYTRWVGDREIMTLEEENILLARQGLFIATERERLGLGNYLETKQSQSSFQDAITRLVNARYNLKQSEMALRRLSGSLTRDSSLAK